MGSVARLGGPNTGKDGNQKSGVEKTEGEVVYHGLL